MPIALGTPAPIRRQCPAFGRLARSAAPSLRTRSTPVLIKPPQCAKQLAAPVDLVDQVLAGLQPQAGSTLLSPPDQQRELNQLLEQLSSQQAKPDAAQLPGNYILLYVSSPNSRALSKSRVERVLRNTALRRLTARLPLNVMGRVMESQVFEDFARQSFDEADLDRDGRLTCAEFWVSMLLMYNRVNAWLPFKAVPPNRTEITDIFAYYDKDGNETLSFDEFRAAVCALLVDEDSLADSFLYRWVKTVVTRLWIQPFEIVMNFLPKSVVDTSLVTTEKKLGITRLLFERKELLQQVAPGSIRIACDFKILRVLPGNIGVIGTFKHKNDTLRTKATFQPPQVSLPLGVHIQFGKPRSSTYQTAYVDDRIKVVVGEKDTYYLFLRLPDDDPRVACVNGAGTREMQPATRLMLVAVAGLLSAGAVAVWEHDKVLLLIILAVLTSLSLAVGEQVALNALQFGNEAAGLPADSVDDGDDDDDDDS